MRVIYCDAKVINEEKWTICSSVPSSWWAIRRGVHVFSLLRVSIDESLLTGSLFSWGISLQHDHMNSDSPKEPEMIKWIIMMVLTYKSYHHWTIFYITAHLLWVFIRWNIAKNFRIIINVMNNEMLTKVRTKKFLCFGHSYRNNHWNALAMKWMNELINYWIINDFTLSIIRSYLQ